ncbi:MAG: exodeoxyribonuclease VII small subunit [Erysipelotrichaceae bacterium]|nr:exodeoxyribonuclease VII small subunit [Erysipelotrichaceae bacterium]
MSLFEEGLKLSKQCSDQLKTFEDRMDQLLHQQEETNDEQ